jgi:signal transduction histidine kinase
VEFLRVYYLTGIKSKKIVKKYPKFIKIFNSKDDLFLKNKKEDISRINTFLWQEKYFEDVIELFESLNSGNLELFLDKITKITSATKITHMINEISDNAPLIFLIDDDKISSVFRFEIMLDTQRALFNISTPFSNWRNPEIVTALKSIITILQISSEKSFLKQQSYKLDKLIYFNEKARQVAHDIRSPLAALDVVLHEDTVTFEQKRVIIRTATNRIHEIANDLLFQNRLSEAHLENKNLHQRVMLLDIVNNVLVEKRFEFRNRGQSLFSTIFPSRTYGIFGLVCAGELKRVLSNLLNNAIDATDIVSGEIVVSLELRDNKSVIGIRDNGKGISSESLTKLGKQGFTFGKGSGGSGLGFFHAKKTIVSFGGEIKVESKVGVGTTVSIYLPLAEPPKTFVNNITVKKGDIVAIVDDDQSIHQVWESKLAGVKMEHFNSTLNVKSNADFYLVDYEFLGEEKSGLDFIEENNLASKAILVTSRYEDPEIQERCERQNIKLLSKGLVPYVSVVIEKDFDTILIDDDELVRMVWDSKAKEKGVEFKSYADPSEANFEGLNKEACIYIDSNLANGLKGEELALKLFNDGFKNIYMATGYNPEDFKDLTFLKGVIGKSPPWA